MTIGELNHNPCNLRWNPNIAWKGLADPPHDARGYCTFIDDHHGLRAAIRDLKIAYSVDGLTTPLALINHFAPPSENDTQAYIRDFCARTGVAPGADLDFADDAKLVGGLIAVIWHENGQQPYSMALISSAFADAMGRALNGG